MRNRFISMGLMFVWSILLVAGTAMTVPPRRLTLDHLLGLSLIPVGAFISALPGVPIRWFAYIALLISAAFISVSGYHIMGTSRAWGLGEGMKIYIVPSLIAVSLALASMAAACFRLRLHEWIKRMKTMRTTPRSVRR